MIDNKHKNVHVKNVLQRYEHTCNLLHQVLPEDAPLYVLPNPFIHGRPYYGQIYKSAYELLVEIELLDSTISLKDLVEFNALNALMIQSYEFQISIPIEDVAEVFDIDVLFAYAICMSSRTFGGFLANTILTQLKQIDYARPTLLAKLFVQHPDDFISAIQFSESTSLACVVQQLFKSHFAIDKSLFGTVARKFKEKMHDVQAVSLHMH